MFPRSFVSKVGQTWRNTCPLTVARIARCLHHQRAFLAPEHSDSCPFSKQWLWADCLSRVLMLLQPL